MPIWYPAMARSSGLGRRDRQEGRDALAANVVDARVNHVVALDLDHDRRVEALAVELAERHGEVGGMAAPVDREVGTQRHLRRPLRPAHCDLPLASVGGNFLLLGKLFA